MDNILRFEKRDALPVPFEHRDDVLRLDVIRNVSNAAFEVFTKHWHRRVSEAQVRDVMRRQFEGVSAREIRIAVGIANHELFEKEFCNANKKGL